MYGFLDKSSHRKSRTSARQYTFQNSQRRSYNQNKNLRIETELATKTCVCEYATNWTKIVWKRLRAKEPHLLTRKVNARISWFKIDRDNEREAWKLSRHSRTLTDKQWRTNPQKWRKSRPEYCKHETDETNDKIRKCTGLRKEKPLYNQKAANRKIKLPDQRPDYLELEKNLRKYYKTNRKQKFVSEEGQKWRRKNHQ